MTTCLPGRAPDVPDLVEADTIQLELDLACDRVPDEALVVLRKDVGWDGEVREAVELQVLSPDRSRRQGRGRARRLPELDDSRPGAAAATARSSGSPQSGSKTYVGSPKSPSRPTASSAPRVSARSRPAESLPAATT